MCDKCKKRSDSKRCKDKLANTNWQLTLAAVPLPDIPIYGNIHFDGTYGYTGNDTAASGQTDLPLPGFPVQSTVWSGKYKKIGHGVYKLFHTYVFLNNPTPETPGVLLPFVRIRFNATVRLSSDCKTLTSLEANVQLFALDDPTLSTPLQTLPVAFTGNRIDF